METVDKLLQQGWVTLDYRSAWIDAVEYTDGMNEKDSDRRPTRDLAMDTLMGVLKGEILIQNHCYRAGK